MIELQKSRTRYYKWTLVVAYLESWVQTQAIPNRYGVYADKCWSYAKAIVQQEVDNHIRAGVSEEMAVARVWEMVEAACRGQPLVEVTQVLLNLMWIGQCCNKEDWAAFMRDLDQTFRAAHRDTEYFNLPARCRQGKVDFVDPEKNELRWKKSGDRPSDIVICHKKDSPADPFASKELLSMLLALPQEEFDALHLPESIRRVANKAPARKRGKKKQETEYDLSNLIEADDTNDKFDFTQLVGWTPGGASDDEFH